MGTTSPLGRLTTKMMQLLFLLLLLGPTCAFQSSSIITPAHRQSSLVGRRTAFSNNAPLSERHSMIIRPTTTTTTTTSTQLHLSLMTLPALPTIALPSVDGSALAQFFFETLITTGVPMVAALVVIAFIAKTFGKSSGDRGDNKSRDGAFYGPVDELYDDLYGTSTKPTTTSPFSFGRNNKNNKNYKNLGIPSQQFLKITKLNDKLDSYQFSVTAATKSKALAAAHLRQTNFDRALTRGIANSAAEQLTPAQKAALLKTEAAFLQVGSKVLAEIAHLEQQVTVRTMDKEFERLGIAVGQVDPKVTATTTTTADNNNKEGGVVMDAEVVNDNDDDEPKKSKNEKKDHNDKNGEALKKMPSFMEGFMEGFTDSSHNTNRLLGELEKVNTQLVRLELQFVKQILDIMGADRANGIRAALLGAGGGAGSLLRKLQDRPLSTILSQLGYLSDDDERRKSLFVTEFPGDVTASQVATLREEVTAIVRNAQPGDEALVVLQSGGGTVTGYGLAASQLQRFREKGMKLTICVEQVAASGGYMMCCVADRIVASPFAVLGSIGVISDIPNVYERLKKEGIEFQTVTAGKFKRTLTPTKKVTQGDFDKSKADVEDILKLFKDFVKENRPQLDVDNVATGETWFGTDALEKGLCDEIKPADDVLMEYVDEGFDVFDVKYEPEGSSQLDALRNLVPAQAQSGKKGLVGRAVQWLVRNVMSELKDEFASALTDEESNNRVDPSQRYMMKDPSDTANRIRVQD